MFTTLISLAALSTLALRGALADFTVDSPAIDECGSVHLTWSGQASGPVNAIIVAAENPCDSLILDLGDHSNGAMTFTANITAGTKVMVSLEDEAGNEAWSNEITVGKGNSTVPCQASVSASASASAAPSGSAGSAQPVSPTTLVVPPVATGSSSSNTDGSDGTDPAVPLGAVNQGLNPNSNGASGLHRLSVPVVAFTALAAAFAVAF